jgi:DNA (cytosine-5)-methyltransferase 1
MNYYNEFEPKAADWLEELIFAGEIPYGVVDRRSIEDVTPADLAGYAQCHFFAGIGGWPLALKLAGVPESTRLWTGSCPCQPFSAAGAGAGFADERHLWPAWQWLIKQRRPAAILGEQVASAAVGPWIDLVSTDLEAMGYAFGAYAGPAAGIGAPHIRDRTYWVAHASGARLQVGERLTGVSGRAAGAGAREAVERGGVRAAVGLADSASSGRREECEDVGRRLGGDRAQGFTAGSEHGGGDHRPGPVNGHWRAADWLGCRDGKWRPVEPGTFPLAHGLPARVGRLRGYGNAIVPAQAAEFIKAVML